MKTNSIIFIAEYFVKSFLILWIIRKLRVIPHILFDIQYIQLYFRPAFTKQSSCNSSIYWWSLQIKSQFLCFGVRSFFLYIEGDELVSCQRDFVSNHTARESYFTSGSQYACAACAHFYACFIGMPKAPILYCPFTDFFNT